jgi:DoxX-like family
MSRDRIIYWITTGLIGLMMLFSAFQYFTNPQMSAAFVHLGFPDYFRVELACAKIVGVLLLLLPMVPMRIKEWAYAGFGIVFISAAIAHASSGDAAQMAVIPLVFFIILIVSYIYAHKTQTT